jgi:hypothetical protein
VPGPAEKTFFTGVIALKKISIFAAVFFAVTVLSGFSAVAQDAGIYLEKRSFLPGEQISVEFTALADFAYDAWVGIIPSEIPHGDESTNDRYDLQYHHLENRTGGTLLFVAPGSPGSYDLRMHDTDKNGREVASVSFQVTGEGSAVAPSLMLERTGFVPGEEIVVTFTAPSTFASNAWVGIIPSNIPHGDESRNDKYDISYLYLNNLTGGVLEFKAPPSEGKYDLRMHDTDNNGREVATVSFTVSAAGLTKQ